MPRINRSLVSWLVVLALLAVATGAVAQEALQPTALVGVWSIRRDVQMSQGCTARGTRQGDQLASIWAVDAIDGGTVIRVTPLGATEVGSSYTAMISGTQLQMRARASWGATTIFLSKVGDHGMTGTETIDMGSCTATRALTATRIH